MDECMPHYYRITNGHGQGAEKLMTAEASFLQGRFDDAHIALERAYAQIQGNGQMNMALCCDFLAWRLTPYTGAAPRYTFQQRRGLLMQHHNTDWLHILDAACAYYHALLGQPEKIPAVFREHQLSSINYLAPGKPMMEMIENQVYLAQGSYAKVIGRSEGLLAMCGAMHYALVALHIRIQTAAAYEMLGKHGEAQALLAQALSDAAPDGFLLPFAENYRYLSPLLHQDTADLAPQIIALGEAAASRLTQTARPAALAALTEREYEVVGLMAQRLSNREIAEKLFLTEGSVKQYIKQIYSKLHIEGDTRTKRGRLSELLETKT